jgi:hypothetical protein
MTASLAFAVGYAAGIAVVLLAYAVARAKRRGPQG